MKAIFTTLFLIALTSIFSAVNLNGQTMAVGHVSAEIIESVSVSSSAVTNFDILNSKASSSNSNVSLGEMKVNSGAGVAYNVVVKPATLSNINGSSFTIEPTSQSGNQLTSGNQTLRLSANTNSVQGKESGLYQGSYSVVFAYN
ncbi:MAG: hypothetical protein H6Q22_136 [Bacteroidetes bacterium]|nr:hypothetical protein [Bacteroidota bacterium]